MGWSPGWKYVLCACLLIPDVKSCLLMLGWKSLALDSDEITDAFLFLLVRKVVLCAPRLARSRGIILQLRELFKIIKLTVSKCYKIM